MATVRGCGVCAPVAISAAADARQARSGRSRARESVWVMAREPGTAGTRHCLRSGGPDSPAEPGIRRPASEEGGVKLGSELIVVGLVGGPLGERDGGSDPPATAPAGARRASSPCGSLRVLRALARASDPHGDDARRAPARAWLVGLLSRGEKPRGALGDRRVSS